MNGPSSSVGCDGSVAGSVWEGSVGASVAGSVGACVAGSVWDGSVGETPFEQAASRSRLSASRTANIRFIGLFSFVHDFLCRVILALFFLLYLTKRMRKCSASVLK